MATLVGSATLVAVTVTLLEVVDDGAVNKPLLEIVPALACQVTAVLLVEVRVAENCCLAPGETVTATGERFTTILDDGAMVTSETATAPSSATLVAVTVTIVDDVTEGAVNRPPLEIVPALACQIISVLVNPGSSRPVEVTVAANCRCAPEDMVIAVGERLILKFELLEEVDWLPAVDEIPAQPTQRQASTNRKITVPSCLIARTVALPFW